MIGILVISRYAAPPYPAAPDFPPSGGQNKTPRNTLFINGSAVSTGYCATELQGWQRRYKKWRRRRHTSPAGTVSQPIGKPFNGQAKGLLWLTWRSYAGPPQYIYLPRAEARSPSGRRQPVPDRTLGAQGQRPGGWLNPHARKGVSTFGNTGKHRPSPGPDPDRAERRLNPQAPKGLVHQIKKHRFRGAFAYLYPL